MCNSRVASCTIIFARPLACGCDLCNYPRMNTPYHIPLRAPVEAKFEASYIPEPNSGCWLWIGRGFYSPAGEFRGHIRIAGKNHVAARLAHELFIGPIPARKLVLHKCSNSACVNPEHIYAGTHQQNTDDMVRAGRGCWQQKPYRERTARVSTRTHCKRSHDLSVAGVYLRPAGYAECRECKRLSSNTGRK